jgi:hypothetical protein
MKLHIYYLEFFFSDTPTFLRVIQYMGNRLVASDNPTNQINAIKLYMKYIEHSNNTSEKAFFEYIIERWTAKTRPLYKV